MRCLLVFTRQMVISSAADDHKVIIERRRTNNTLDDMLHSQVAVIRSEHKYYASVGWESNPMWDIWRVIIDQFCYQRKWLHSGGLRCSSDRAENEMSNESDANHKFEKRRHSVSDPKPIETRTTFLCLLGGSYTDDPTWMESRKDFFLGEGQLFHS